MTKYMIAAIEQSGTEDFKVLEVRFTDTENDGASKRLITNMVKQIRKYRTPYKDMKPKQILDCIQFHLYVIDPPMYGGHPRHRAEWGQFVHDNGTPGWWMWV